MIAKSVLVPLGVVVRPHGVRGELHVKLFNPHSQLLHDQSRILLCKESEMKIAELEYVHSHKEGVVLLAIRGCETREQAQALRGMLLCLDRKDLPALAPDEFYHVDMIGSVALDPGGERVGEVMEVMAYPTVDVARIRSEKGILEVPLIDPYFVHFDMEKGHIVVDKIEDLEWIHPIHSLKRS